MTNLTADELAKQTLDHARYGNSNSWIVELLAQEARDLADLLAQLDADPNPNRQRVGQILTNASALQRNGVKP